MERKGPDHHQKPSAISQGTITNSTSKPVSWQDFFDLVDRSEIPSDFMTSREVLPAAVDRLICSFDGEILDWQHQEISPTTASHPSIGTVTG